MTRVRSPSGMEREPKFHWNKGFKVSKFQGFKVSKSRARAIRGQRRETLARFGVDGAGPETNGFPVTM